MNDEDQKLIEEAEDYIKEHKRELIERFADPKVYLPDEHPISLFMAGSPGAGKTEVSKRLIDEFSGKLPVRIDADEIRSMFSNYTGANSDIFQPACSTGVNKLFDYVLKYNINAILDGTFGYGRAMENIERSLSHKRRVIIYYLFQDPKIAWKFTQIRENQEGRKVPKEAFVSSFIRARENVNAAKVRFGSAITVNMIIKDFATDFEKVLPNVENIDEHLPKVYTTDELNALL